MKSILLLLSAVFLFNLSSCSSGGNSSTSIFSKNDKKWEAGKDYQIVKRYRIEDKYGFGQPVVAYSLILPDAWNLTGGISWKVGTPCTNECVANRMTATSPDKEFQLDFFPLRSWEWTDDQMMLQSKLANASMGCSVMPAMDASAYLRNQFIAELGNPKIIDIKPNKETEKIMKQQAEQNANSMKAAGVNTVEYRPSAIEAKLAFANGREGIALVSVNQTIFYMMNFMQGGYSGSYTCQANQKIVLTYPKGKEEEARKILSMAVSSIRINPTWQNAVSQVFNNIARVEQRETAKRGEIWRKTQAEISEIQQSTWESSQNSRDRINEEFGRTIRGVEKWTDPATGQSTDLSLGYNEAWSKGDGTYILSNDPLFDPSVVLQENWKALKKGD